MNRKKVDQLERDLKIPASGMLEIVKSCCPIDFGMTGYREANGWVDADGKCYAEKEDGSRDLRYCIACWCERLSGTDKPCIHRQNANVDNLVERLRKETTHETVCSRKVL